MTKVPMHGPVAVAMFWIWLGFIAAAAFAYVVYRLLRTLPDKKERPPTSQPMKYAKNLGQRLREKSSLPASVQSDRPAAPPKPPPPTK